jgi:PBSX family phage portal protein
MQATLAKAHILGGQPEVATTRQLPETPWSGLYADGAVVEPPFDLDALAALYETNAAHKACVDAKVTNIVGLGFRFESRGGDAESLDELQGLFDNCNPDMTFTEVMRGIWTDVECVGNGYLEVTRDNAGGVNGFFHVPATTVRASADKRTYVQIRAEKRQWFRSLGTPPVDGLDDCTELMHFSKYTPQSSYYGVPDIVAGLSGVAGDKAARDYNLDFFEHNAVPRMAIIVEGGQLSGELIAQIQQFMEREIRGQGHKTLLLDVPGGDVRVRLEPLTVGASEDAAFLEYRRANRDEVMMVHRVPPSKVTVVENSNLANSEGQDKTFREQVVRPEQRRIEYRLNKLIREQIGVSGWDFRFREMDLGEERDNAEIARLYAEMGVWDADEIRAKLGLSPRPAQA